jgi:nitrite reductase/ring-hydroxylating ferredoxin subunit
VLNAGAVGLYAGSLLARVRGDRRAGTLLALSGLAAVTASGYLGGHLSFGHGVGVNHAFFQRGPDDWTEALAADDLEAGTPRRVDVGGATVLLVRRGEEILAIGSRCTHAGGPLEEGTMDPRQGTVQCPWHQSVFRLDDGTVVHGPASVPEHAYDVRVRNGAIELRRRATT